MERDRLRGHLDLVLLSVLSRGPGHGYAVITELRNRTDGVLDVAEGSVYPALHRLEDVGWVTSAWQPAAGRRRRLYRLTEAGAAELARQTRDWRTLRAAVDAVLGARARFAG